MQPAAKFCPFCGAASQPGAKFCSSCGQPQPYNSNPAPASPTGQLASSYLLKQRYRITGNLGQGGFGAVYKAEDITLNNVPRAIKEMSQSNLSPQEIQQATDAFQQEAVLLASLMHPNLPRIYDHFEENGHWYLVMDYIEGETLEERQEKTTHGALPLADALAIGLQLCTVLGYLHTRPQPIIFRDLKPANVMLTAEEHLYLIDFGIARIFKQGQPKDTLILGSPGYAAPEQYGRSQTTEQTDIYSLGATLHHLLSGHDPSQSPFQFQLLTLPSPAGPALASLIARMLAMDKQQRPGSMQEVKQELERIAGQIAANRVPPVPVQPAVSFRLPKLQAKAPPEPKVDVPPGMPIIVAQQGNGHYTTINAAIRDARPNAQIIVRIGTYTEALVIDKPLKIVGEGPREQIVIESEQASCLRSQASVALVRGFTLRHLGRQPAQHDPQHHSGYAVDILTGQLTISECDITSNTGAAIGIHHAEAKPVIHHCTIHHSAGGIVIYDQAQATIKDCDIHSNTRPGIIIQKGGNPQIRRCNIYNGAHIGILVQDSGQGTIEECDIYNNARAGVMITQNSTPIVRGCKIRQGSQYGLYVLDNGLGTIEGCEIYANTRAGIGIAQGGNPTIRHCMIHDELQFGMLIRSRGQGTIESCTIRASMSAGITILQGSNPQIRRCHIHEGIQTGIYIRESGLGTIEECAIYANDAAGIAIEQGGDPLIRRCHIHHNKRYGIAVRTRGFGTIEDCTFNSNRPGAWNIEPGSQVRRHRNEE